MDTTVNVIVTDAQEKKFAVREVATVEEIMSCKTLGEAYKLCYSRSVPRKPLQDIASDCEMSVGTLSRILGSGDVCDRRHMPHEKVIPFMLACGNSIPLQWLQLQWQKFTKPNSQSECKSVNAADVINRLDGIEAQVRLILSEVRKPSDELLSVSNDAVLYPVGLSLDLVAIEMMLYGGGE